MKQTTILISVLFGLLTTATANPSFAPIEQQTVSCPCACDKEQDLQVLRTLYANNGGENWVFPANSVYEDVQINDFRNVPNAGVPWDIDAPNASDLMGTWHGIATNENNCITEIILWTGPYNVENMVNFAPQGIGLTGELPENIGQLCALEKLLIPHNDLTGAIPSSIGDLCNLEVLLLHNNNLSDTIPSEIGNLNTLQQLGLHFNELNGSLPASIINNTALEILHLNNNKLSGTLPEEIGNLDKLLQIDLSHNAFTGIVPASISNIGSNNSMGGQIAGLYLQSNALDSLPDISTLSVIDGGEVDISGNHFTFDDIIPNITVLTNYSDQTLDLNQSYCAMVGDELVITPGFDNIIDEGTYGVYNTYHWSRPGTSYRDTSELNFITFSDVSPFSAGTFAIEVTNVLAPDLRLQVSNLVVDVGTEPNLIGTFDVCANSEESYSIFFGAGEYDFTVRGGEAVSSNSFGITVLWNRDTLAGQVCATSKGFCQLTTCVDVAIAPRVTVFIAPPDTLSCNKKISTLRSRTEERNLAFSWYAIADTIALGQADTLDITRPGNYVLKGINDRGCEAKDTTFVVEQIDKFDVAIEGATVFCQNEGTTLKTSANFSSYLWSTGETTATIEVEEEGLYQVTVTNDNDCTAFDAFEVQSALSVPTLNLTKSGDLDCTNEEVILSYANASTSLLKEWKNAAGVIVSNEDTFTISTPGIYSLTIATEEACSTTAQIEVVQDDAVVIPLIAGTTSLCEGATGHLSLEESYASYLWSTGDTTSFISINDERLVYSVTVTSETGCSGSSSVTIQQRPKPTLVIGGQKEICPAQDTRLFVSDEFISYLWTTGDTTAEIFADAVGIYTVTITDENNCTNVAETEITAAMPFIATIEGETQFCEGNYTTLQANQLANATYEWSIGEDNSSITAFEAGTYEVTITDANNCTSAASVTVEVSPTPPITFKGDTTLCEGESSELTIEETYTTYNWRGGATLQSIQIDGPGTYRVTVTDATNCSNTAAISITEQPGIKPEIEGSLFLCEEGTVTLSAKKAYATYTWSTGEDSKSITIDEAGEYSLQVTNANGCVGDTTVRVTNLNNPTPQIVGNTTLCKGAATNLKTSMAYLSYQWSTGDTTATALVNTSGNYQVTVSNDFGCTGVSNFTVEEAPDLAVDIIGNTSICAGSSTTLQADGNYLTYKWSTGADSAKINIQEIGTYSLTVTDPSGCTGIAMIEVTENSAIFPQIIGTTTLCGGAATTIRTDTEYASYLWSTGDTSQIIEVADEGTYEVTVSNASGCTGKAIIAVTNSTPIQPEIKGDLAICEGQTTTLSLDKTYSNYVWTGGVMRPTLEVEQEGTYSVVVTDENGCTGQTTVTVEIGQLTPPEIDVESAFLCAGSFVTINAETGFANYAWSNDQFTPSLFVPEPGLYTLTVTDESGCEGVNSIEIIGLPSPTLDSVAPQEFCSIGPAGVQLNTPDRFEQYIWSTGDTTSETTIFAGGTYQVTVTNEFECTGIASYEIIEQEASRINLVAPKDTLDCRDRVLGLTAIKTTIDPYLYRWEYNNGLLPDTTEALKVTQAGIYKLMATNLNNGCTSTFERTIVEAENSVQLVTEDKLKAIFCDNRTTTIDFSNSNNVDKYEWELHIAGGFRKELTATAPIYTADETGRYLTIGTNNATGCTDSAWVEVIDTTYTLMPTVTAPTQLCELEKGEIWVNENYESYRWNQGSTTQNIQIGQGSFYAVEVTDRYGCTGRAEVEIERAKAVTLDVTLDRDITQVCEGGAVELDFVVRKNGVGPYNLVLSDGIEELLFDTIDNNAGLELFPTVANKYSIMEVVDLGNNCYIYDGNSPVVEFQILPIPTANSVLKNNCKSQGEVGSTFDLAALEVNIKNEPSSFVDWYEDTLSTNTITNEPFYTSTTNTTLYARTNNGNCYSQPVPIILTTSDCTTSLEFNLEIGEELNLNDLPGTKREVYITNRWGDLVYASNDYEGDANKFRGASLPQGAYYIYIKNEERQDDVHVPYKGVIYLLK